MIEYYTIFVHNKITFKHKIIHYLKNNRIFHTSIMYLYLFPLSLSNTPQNFLTISKPICPLISPLNLHRLKYIFRKVHVFWTLLRIYRA